VIVEDSFRELAYESALGEFPVERERYSHIKTLAPLGIGPLDGLC
jgi:hypothetical protein